MTAVSHCLHNAYKIVIKNQTQGSHGIYLEIQGGFRQNICWCFHKDQNLRCKHNTASCKKYTAQNTKSHRGMNRPVKLLLLPCAKISRYDNACSHSKTLKKSYQQKCKTAG